MPAHADDAAPPASDGRRLAFDAPWLAWRREGRGSCLLLGEAGAGKSSRWLPMLAARVEDRGGACVLLEVPPHPLDLEAELLGALHDRLCGPGAPAARHRLSAALSGGPSLAIALRRLLEAGAWVVIDELQRVFEPATPCTEVRPAGRFGELLVALAGRPADVGCLCLVSDRDPAPAWASPFHAVRLPLPEGLDERCAILRSAAGDGLSQEDALRLAARIGATPAALDLAGRLLALAGPAAVDAALSREGPAGPALQAAALDRLAPPARALVRACAALGPGAVDAELVCGSPAEAATALQQAVRFGLLVERCGRWQAPADLDPGLPAADVQALHRRAGAFHAGCMPDVATAADPACAVALSAAVRHLARAGEAEALRQLLAARRAQVDRQFGWRAHLQVGAAERDARIALLDALPPAVRSAGLAFTHARLLRQRAAPGDLAAALAQARQAVRGQTQADPWVLLVKLVHEDAGPAAAATAAAEACERVSPNRNLYAVYQLLGACLVQQGRADDAVAALLAGARRVQGNGHRLLEEALYFAAAEPHDGLLQRLAAQAARPPGSAHLAALADVLVQERAGDWAGAAALARRARRTAPRYMQLALHEALAALGAGDGRGAQAALDGFPAPWRHGALEGNTWLAAFVALEDGRPGDAAALAGCYFDAPAPREPQALRAALLRAWDASAGRVGESTPALMAPVLPGCLRGGGPGLRRPQYGPPALATQGSVPG